MPSAPAPFASTGPSASPPITVPAASQPPTPPPTPRPPSGAQREVFGQAANTLTRGFANPACPQGEAKIASPLLAAGEAAVGWNFAAGIRCGVIYRSGIWFGELQNLKGTTVLDARLSFYVARSQSSSQGHPLTGQVSCLGQLQMATAIWMNNPNSPTALLGTPYLAFPGNRPGDTEIFGKYGISQGMFVSLDVSDAVQQWVSGTRPNYGFVLVPDQNTYSGPTDRCYSRYHGFTLTVDVKK